MNRENRLLDLDELVEFRKQLLEAEDFMKITDRFRGIYGTI
jgi:hypothetical protein